MREPRNKVVQVMVTESMLKQLNELAEQQGVSLSATASMLLNKQLKVKNREGIAK